MCKAILVHTAPEEAKKSVSDGGVLVLHGDEYFLHVGGLQNIAVLCHKFDWLLEEVIVA